MPLDEHALRQSCVRTDADMRSAKVLLRACSPCSGQVIAMFLVPRSPAHKT